MSAKGSRGRTVYLEEMLGKGSTRLLLPAANGEGGCKGGLFCGGWVRVDDLEGEDLVGLDGDGDGVTGDGEIGGRWGWGFP